MARRPLLSHLRLPQLASLLILALLSSTARAVIPAPSAGCRAAAAAFVASASPASSCSALLVGLFSNTAGLAACVAVPGGSFPAPPWAATGVPLDCSNVMTLMAQQSPALVSPAPLADARYAAACPLCNATDVDASCAPLLALLAQAALDPAAASAATSGASAPVAAACASGADGVALSALRLQSSIVCASASVTANQTVLTVSDSFTGFDNKSYVVGALDLRTLTQCGRCSMIPCTPGMSCLQNKLPTTCPAGSYCATPVELASCPEGSYCPEGSIAPIKCRATAAGTCSPGSEREVVWVPSLIAVLIVAAIVVMREVVRRDSVPALRSMFGSPQKYAAPPTATTAPMTNQASGAPDENEDVASPVDTRPGLRVSFDRIRLVSGANVRLTDATGTLQPGRFTAIIGGSGAGKTSLLNVLLGRERQTSGTVAFVPARPDAVPLTESEMQRVVAFVPQTDVMLRELPVEQLLLHSARSRLSPTIGDAGAIARVERVLQQLGIVHLRHALVGSGEDAANSLSAGERKLVNIGIELCADPLAVFLDEPTTGLDASAAMRVARIVRGVASSGLTVVAVVHQPRGEIFKFFDEVLLLVPGGRIAYHGPASGALVYFAARGHTCAPAANKTDWLLDLVSGATGARDDFAGAWEADGAAFIASLAASSHAPSLSPSTSATAVDANGLVVVGAEPSAHGASFLTQVLLSARRSIMQRLVSGSLLVDVVSHFIGGVAIGIVTSGGSLFLPPIPPQYAQACPPGSEVRCSTWLRMMVEPATFYLTMTLGSLGVPPAVRAIGAEKEVFQREAYVGASPVAYYVGKAVADLPYFALLSFIYIAPLIAIAPWRAPTHEMYAVCVCISVFISSLGQAFALLFSDPDSATLVGVITAILMNLFGGFVPKLGTLGGGVWAFTHWAARAIVAVELGHGQGLSGKYFDANVPAEHRTPDYGSDLGILLAFAAATHLCALLMLLRSNKARTGWLF